MFDLDAYLVRIGYNGTRKTTPQTLGDIHWHHAQAIPFENLDVLAGRGVSIGIDAIARKLVGERRGGYCFEHGFLLLAVLRELGFSAAPLIARVRPPGATAIAGLTHMLLRVECGGRTFFADTGYGGLSLSRPLELRLDAEQPEAGLEPRRLVAEGSLLVHQVLINGSWSDVYAFSPAEAPSADFEIANWYTSTHPESRFVRNLTAARLDGQSRHSLLNREYTLRRIGSPPESRSLESPGELLEVLDRHFGLRFPSGTRFGPAGSPWPT